MQGDRLLLSQKDHTDKSRSDFEKGVEHTISPYTYQELKDEGEFYPISDDVYIISFGYFYLEMGADNLYKLYKGEDQHPYMN